MKTKLTETDISEAAEILRSGGTVAVPTETVYGLAVNGLDEKAVADLYELKGRSAVKPLSLMVEGPDSIESYCTEIPDQAIELAEKFWPGPLTIILKSKSLVPEIVRAGGETVGLRCPDSAKTLELLSRAEIPLAAPSANPSGEESPKTAQKVLEYFDGKIDMIIDGGECYLGLESTIIDMSAQPYKIIRQGALSAEAVTDALVENLNVIGITGGTGVGKTTALNVLEGLGARVIDCDALYHGILENDQDLINEIGEHFPGVADNGAVDRKKLGNIVFSSADRLQELNQITHKYIDRKVKDVIDECAMSGRKTVAIDAVELIESGLAEQCDLVVGVIADAKSRKERIIERDSISEDYAVKRIEAQKTDEYYTENCDHVLVNNGTEPEFIEKCKEYFTEVL